MDVLTEAQKYVEFEAEGFDSPDEDFLPAVMVVDEDDHVTIAVLDPQFLANDATKDVLADEVFAEIARETKAREMAFISSSWALKLPPGMKVESLKEWHGRYGEHPERVEQVGVLAVREDLSLAPAWAVIQRHESDPPTLGEWTIGEEERDDKARAGGRMAEGLIAALQNKEDG